MGRGADDPGEVGVKLLLLAPPVFVLYSYLPEIALALLGAALMWRALDWVTGVRQ